ncbi:MAG: hypothetical protein K2X35_01415 [Bryobacteraceae bacterium]|nr:hypothetical protein [Bryobacteraceae bacterium]
MGDPLILWTVRLSLIAAFAAGVQHLRGRPFRALWTVAFALYLAHVAAAFHYRHNWSHFAALADTARQTRELTGFDYGGGLWWNYGVTALWAFDVALLWTAGRRPRRWARAFLLFWLFMAVNGAVVFAAGPIRWLGAAALLIIAALYLRKKLNASLS